jgi:threonine dehydrogenase-like Zn-dependent dehydrogenase
LAIAGGGRRIRNQLTRYSQLTIEASGNPAALPEALRITEDYGTIIMVGDPPDPSEQRLTSDFLLRGLTLTGSHFTHASMDDPSADPRRSLTHAGLAASFFQHLAEKRLEVRSLITHRVPPEQAELAYALAAARVAGTMGILFEWR